MYTCEADYVTKAELITSFTVAHSVHSTDLKGGEHYFTGTDAITDRVVYSGKVIIHESFNGCAVHFLGVY